VMRKRALASLTALAAMAFALGVLLAIPKLDASRAWAGQLCPAPGEEQVPATVTVTRPRSRETVSGMVQVTGHVESSPTAPLSRVELWVDPILVDSAEFGSTAATTFSLQWDSRAHAEGDAGLRVVTCGDPPPPPQGRGQTMLTVTVQQDSPTPTNSASSPPDIIWPTLQPSNTQSAPPSPARGNASASPKPAPLPPPGPSPAAPQSPAGSSAPSVLKIQDSAKSPRAPLWVGLVMGGAGTLGLGFSLLRHRHEGSRPH